METEKQKLFKESIATCVEIFDPKSEIGKILPALNKNEMEWINVQDRLPETYSRVLVFKKDGVLKCYGTAFYNGKHFLFDSTIINFSIHFESVSDTRLTGVTHWTPLPQNHQNNDFSH